LPNPEVTPNWRTYAPTDCQSNPDACAQDNRFCAKPKKILRGRRQ